MAQSDDSYLYESEDTRFSGSGDSENKWKSLTLEDELAYAEDGDEDYLQAEYATDSGDVHQANIDAATNSSNALRVGEKFDSGGVIDPGSSSASAVVSSDGGAVTASARMHHRREIPETLEQHSPVGSIIWALVILHFLALAVWLRAWWRQKRAKDPTMRTAAKTAPPQKQTCTYDMDKSYAIPKIELPIKALKLARA